MIVDQITSTQIIGYVAYLMNKGYATINLTHLDASKDLWEISASQEPQGLEVKSVQATTCML